MRAKKVIESINFQRGIDPKDALKIGYKEYIKSLNWGSYREEFVEMVLDGEGTKYWDIEIVEYKGYKILVAKTNDRYSGKPYWIANSENISPEHNDCYSGSDSRKSALRNVKSQMDRVLRNIEINEAQQFQRGKEAKSALDIGLANKAFPIIAISLTGGEKWFMGMDAGNMLQSILSSRGSIPYDYKSIKVKKDPVLKDWISDTWYLYELQKKGFSGIKWAHIFVPFDGPKLEESVSFERGRDPKEAMDIGRIREIKKWIEFFNLDGRSVIRGFNVIVNGGITFSKFGPNPDAPDMPTTFPMEGLIIKGSFYMDRSSFTELPKRLTVQGPLDLTYYEGTELPEDLIVTGSLVLVNPKNHITIPDNARIDGFIKLEKKDLEMVTIPDHLQDLLLFTDAPKFYESLDFERGKDPKKSMSIGKHSLKKEFTEYYDDMLDYFVENLHILIGEKYKRGLQNSSLTMEEFEKAKEVIKEYLEECTWDEYLLDTNVTFNDLVSRLRSSVTESVNFERGKDPKTAMDIGRAKYAFPVEDIYSRGMRIMPPKKADKYLRTVLPRRLKSVITRPGAVWEWPRFQDGLHYADAKWIMRQGYSGIKYRGTFYPFPEIEGYNFRREEEEWIDESLNFERGKDPKKALRLGRVRPYPDMTVEQFQRWFGQEIFPYIDDDGEQAIVDNLLMNDWESDMEVSKYLMARIGDMDLIDELIRMREYFNDREYINGLFKEDLF